MQLILTSVRQRRLAFGIYWFGIMIGFLLCIDHGCAASGIHDKSMNIHSSSLNNHRTPPIIFANRSWTSPLRRRGFNNAIRDNRQVKETSSRSYSKYYTSSDEYEDGCDDEVDEWERLDRIKKNLQTKLGGYRPWSVDTSSRRAGAFSMTSKLVLANVVMYALQMLYPGITKLGAKRSELILQGKELHRLITPVFLHGSITHIMMNTFSLQNIGPEVERMFGGGRYLCTYLAAGVAGNLVSAYYSPNPSLGASGAVFGLMGAYYAFLSQNEHLLGQSGRDAMGRVSGTFAMNVIFGLASPRIDNWAHMGGALGGG
jgi:membrane associated rhomboid family serine protease